MIRIRKKFGVLSLFIRLEHEKQKNEPVKYIQEITFAEGKGVDNLVKDLRRRFQNPKFHDMMYHLVSMTAEKGNPIKGIHILTSEQQNRLKDGLISL